MKIIKKIHQFIYKKFNSFFFINLSKKIGGTYLTKKDFGVVFNYFSKNYFSFHLRPKYAADYNLINYKKNSNVGIIIQGPVNDIVFLINTIKIYKKIFPSNKVVLSTWSNTDKKFLNKLKKLNIIVLLNKLPTDNGFGNINLQTFSTHAALKYLKDLNIEYAIKTRTDMRVYNPKALNFLLNIFNSYPIKKNTNIDRRIIATDLITCKFRIYGLTDLVLFGCTNDLLLYFTNKNFDREIQHYFKKKHPLIINETPVISEIFLCARYLLNKNIKLLWTLEHWWECLRDYFCIVDSQLLDLYWNKYDKQHEKRFITNYTKKTNRVVDSADWLDLYLNKNVDWNKFKYKEKWLIQNDKLFQKKVM
tara:strand:- start:29 stop:1114 length:1086 start_codon:yes stop_codon:yes gene_type:complete